MSCSTTRHRRTLQANGRPQPDAGHLVDENGTPIMSVAHPGQAPRQQNASYRRPDDLAQNGRSWRAHLLGCNHRREGNDLNLLPAWQLYRQPAYRELVAASGLENVFIPSTGWGLLAADFLTPHYDITFTNQAASYKRRHPRRDTYADFRMLPDDQDQPAVFRGGKDYVELFETLTPGLSGTRMVFYNSVKAPAAPSCRRVRFETTTRTNWHYGR